MQSLTSPHSYDGYKWSGRTDALPVATLQSLFWIKEGSTMNATKLCQGREQCSPKIWEDFQSFSWNKITVWKEASYLIQAKLLRYRAGEAKGGAGRVRGPVSPEVPAFKHFLPAQMGPQVPAGGQELLWISSLILFCPLTCRNLCIAMRIMQINSLCMVLPTQP